MLSSVSVAGHRWFRGVGSADDRTKTEDSQYWQSFRDVKRIQIQLVSIHQYHCVLVSGAVAWQHRHGTFIEVPVFFITYYFNLQLKDPSSSVIIKQEFSVITDFEDHISQCEDLLITSSPIKWFLRTRRSFSTHCFTGENMVNSDLNFISQCLVGNMNFSHCSHLWQAFSKPVSARLGN